MPRVVLAARVGGSEKRWIHGRFITMGPIVGAKWIRSRLLTHV